jgi:hypothetical protein
MADDKVYGWGQTYRFLTLSGQLEMRKVGPWELTIMSSGL